MGRVADPIPRDFVFPCSENPLHDVACSISEDEVRNAVLPLAVAIGKRTGSGHAIPILRGLRIARSLVLLLTVRSTRCIRST